MKHDKSKYPYSYMLTSDNLAFSSFGTNKYSTKNGYEDIWSTDEWKTDIENESAAIPFNVPDVHYIHFKELFDIFDGQKDYDSLEQQILDAISATCSNKIAPETPTHEMEDAFKKIFEELKIKNFFNDRIKYKLFNENYNPHGSDFVPLENYISASIILFAELIVHAPELKKYLPHLVACYLLNNHPPYKISLCTRLSHVDADYFLERILRYKNPNTKFRYLEDYLNLCNRMFCSNATEKKLTEKSFTTFWRTHYDLIDVFSICATVCKHIWHDECDCSISFLLFFNSIFSQNKNMRFDDFLALFTVFFFPVITTSCYKIAEYDEDLDPENFCNDSVYQTIYFTDPEDIFSHFHNYKHSHLTESNLVQDYIFTLLANYDEITRYDKSKLTSDTMYEFNWENTDFITLCYRRAFFPYTKTSFLVETTDTILENNDFMFPAELLGTQVQISSNQLDEMLKACYKELPMKTHNINSFLLARSRFLIDLSL